VASGSVFLDLPPWARKTPKITEVLPLLYLHGLSSGDFVPALGQFLGSSAGLSAAVITRLTEAWKAEQRTFAGRDLSGVDYVYLWADGIHVNIRLKEHKQCLLVMSGVRAEGRKKLIALADGYRESAKSEPAFAFGLCDEGGQVVADLGNAWPLGGVGPEHGAADVGVFVDAAEFEEHNKIKKVA
jgi:transposase-like protein